MRIREVGEFGLINILVKKILPHSGRVVKGIGDDTAVMRQEPGRFLLMTTDMLVEDIHFSLKYFSLKAVGWKAMAVNVSDIAAMGGVPGFAAVSVSIPPDWEVEQVEELYSGLIDCSREYGIDIVGGDTVSSTKGLTVNVALTGYVEPDRVVYRSGASPGDIIMVTGPLGSSAAGLYVLNKPLPEDMPGMKPGMNRESEVISAHLYPRARLREGRILGGSGCISAMNDISDGLASEVLEICLASSTGCELYEASLPITEAVSAVAEGAGVSPSQWALYGGEDFELVFTVKPDRLDSVTSALKEAGAFPCEVGRIAEPGRGCLLVDTGGRRREMKPRGYNHFGE
ncbi:thiamine-phosphate kinase [Phosphitispora fastidiosa]|uniref:thiamine-phosphate kinase n=1 Tax=Phosphitispora fastidiosa TaxID=2837202 RepID=UPI001E4CCC8A|nr:thiamine-phosphate kinase [Phosphitispora fastidiosa]MBU7008437.1 thiamine-monophosphate kinase [Phosphitispora fastidiosa]